MRNVGRGAACGWRVSNGRINDWWINDWRNGDSRPGFAFHSADRQHGASAHRRNSTAADGQHHRTADWIDCTFDSARIESDQSERELDLSFHHEPQQSQYRHNAER